MEERKERLDVPAAMIRRLWCECLLRPGDVSPSQDDMTVIGVFNPGVIAMSDGAVLLVRVAEQPRETRSGQTALPRWDISSGRIVFDWLREEQTELVDVRVVRLKASGLVRLNFTSHLRVVRSRDGRAIDSIEQTLFRPETVYEEYGVEDPRVTRIGDTYFVTYVAVSRHGVTTALASTKDFVTFERHGILFPPENKDVVLFPEKIGGEYFALHRPTAAPFSRPEMWIASSPDLWNWGRHERLLGSAARWDVGRIGAGAPPIRTERGWLEIYHGNSRRAADPDIGAYSGGALLLDGQNPRRVLGAAGQILCPELEFEREGYIPNVVFPTGVVERGETLLVYYGAADTVTAVVELSRREILEAIRPVG
jgi:predicted GH43/DUF377 family glycosyl hydrolase